MACNLEDIVGMIFMKFDQYACSDGKGSTLSQDEMCKMAIAEFPTLCASKNKDDILKGIIGKMDANNDKETTFQEFMCFLACLSIAIKELCQKK